MWVVLAADSPGAAAVASGDLHIRRLHGFGQDAPLNALENASGLPKGVAVYAGNGFSLVVDTTSTRYGTPYFTDSVIDDRLSLARWAVSGVYDVAILYHTAWNYDLIPAPREYSSAFIPESARLVGSVVVIETFCAVLAELSDGNTVPVIGLGNRNNTMLTAAVSSDGSETVATLTARPGLGAGVVQTCGADWHIATINGMAPDKYGRFSLVASGCLTFDTKHVDVGGAAWEGNEHTLRLVDDCKDCCDCSDFSSAGLALGSAATVYHSIGDNIAGTKTRYDVKVDDWLTRVACANSKLLSLAMTAQVCPYFDVNLQYCNNSDECVRNIVLIADLVLPAGTTVELISAALSSDNRQSVPADITQYPVIKFEIPNVPAKTSDGVKARLRFVGAGVNTDNLPLGFSVCLTGTVDDQLIVSGNVQVVACAALTLACPTNASNFTDVASC